MTDSWRGFKKKGSPWSPGVPRKKSATAAATVKTYGANGKVEAWQLEHGSSLRFDLEKSQAFVRIFVQVLVDNLGTQLRTNRNIGS